MTSMNGVLESRWLIRSRLGPPDVYHQDPKQKEDELTSANVKQGFINQIPYLNEGQEHGSAQLYSLDVNKINRSLNDILTQKQQNGTYTDTAKKRPGLTKDNFWLVLPKNRNNLLAWIKELRAGKSLNHLGKRVPICNRKEEVFQLLAEQQVTIVRATWYIKMTAQYGFLQAEAKNKKNRITADHNPEWTTAICRFMRDQLARLLDDQTLNNSGMVGMQGVEETEKQYEYITKLANHLYAEGMLDRHDFLNWIVETMEKIRLHGTHALTYVMPLVMKHVQDIIKNQLLSRRLAFVISRLLNWLLNDSTWGNSVQRSAAIESPSPLSVGPPSVSGQGPQKQLSAPPTPSQAPKPLSPQKLGQSNSVISVKPRALPTNFPPSLEDLAYGLICVVQCIAMECPGALVWYPPDDPRTPGSPLDYLPVAPSLLPLPSKNESSSSTSNDNLTRARLREVEAEIIQRSFAAEMRWSSDKCQESATGQTINRVLSTLEALDKQQNFDRTDLIDPIYYKIFVQNSNKDGNDQVSQASEEAVIWLLCEWAVSAQRLGEHRAAVVAKLLDKRQMLLEQEQAALVSERTKVLNSSNPTTSNSNPGSVGTILSSPPPQLLVEGAEPPQVDPPTPQQPQLQMQGLLPNNTHMFQNILFNFLDTQAPVLDKPSDRKELQSFKNLVMLFSELIQHDVFSHDEYVNTLISRGDIMPGQISPLPIYNPNLGMNANPAAPLGYTNHSVGVVSVPSVGPTSVGAPVSNKPMDILMKGDPEDDLPSSVRSLDPKIDNDNLLFSPVMNSNYALSPFDRSMSERHFTDVIKKLPDNPKDKSGSGNMGNQVKKPTGPIWGYRQPRHVQFLMHLPIPFEDDDCIHESNQRMMVLYGAGRQRNEVKKEVKKITKHVCKLILKQSSNSPTENSFYPSSVKSTSGGSSKRSKARVPNDLSNSSPNSLLKRFRCLTYFNQHYVTAQAAKAILSSINDYVSDRSFIHLPPLSSITLVLSLMEEALNIGGMVQLSVQIATLLTSLETEITWKHPDRAGCYTKDLALNVVAILRHYQSYLTLDADLTRQAFDAVYAFIKQSNVRDPGHCTSPDRCILIFLYDLFTSLRSKHLLDSQVSKFSSSASAIKQTLCQSKIPATSNCLYDNSFMLDDIQNPTSAHPLLVAQEKCMMLRDATYRYSFVCTTIITMCTGLHTPESLSSIATLCAEMNAQCNDLSSEWLGVLKALCCGSSTTTNFTDVFLMVNPSDEAIRDPLALFTAILIARNCLSMENFIKHVAIPPLLAACKPGLNDADIKTGAHLTCHILLQLFKTPVPPSQASSDSSRSDRPAFYIPEAADRHLLAASQRNIVVGAVLAVLKAIVKLGDASYSGRQSSSPSNNDAGVAAFLAPISGLDDMNETFGIPGQTRPSINTGESLETQSLSEFAKNAVRIICSQQWVRERCLKNIEWDFLMDKELTHGQRQHLIQLICCPEEDLQQLSDAPDNQQRYVLEVLRRMSRWTLRQTLLELQIMLKQAAQDEGLADDIAKSVIEVFKNQNMEPTKDRKSPISGIELDKSNIWLMPPLISELSSQVQAKVLQEASRILETPQHWPRSKSDRERHPGRNTASLLNQQPFLALILTCLKGQDRQRETLLDSLQSQILMFQSEWQEHQRDASNVKDGSMSQTMVQEVLQLRLSLMGGMFDTVQNSSPFTSSVVILLTQLISSGMVDIEVNAKLFHTVFDMIAVLLHGTLGGDSPNSAEWSKRDYMNIVKKIKKEISEIKTPSVKILRRLLPVPRKETFVIACDSVPSADRQGLQIGSKQKVIAWDIIEGLKTSAPLCLPWYGAGKTERKELPYETQQRLMLFHDHELWQTPLSDYLKPPVLPVEEEEKEEIPKNPKRKSTSSSKAKSPAASSSSYGHKDSLLPPNKRPKKEKTVKKNPKKSQDIPVPYQRQMAVPSLSPNLYGHGIGQGNINMGPMQPSSQQMRPSLPPYGNGQSYMPYQHQGSVHQNMNPTQSLIGAQNKGQSQHIKHNLAKMLKTKSQHPQYPQMNQSMGMNASGPMHQPMDNIGRNAIRALVQARMPYRRQSGMAPSMPQMRSVGNPHQQNPMSGYNNYVGPQTGGSGMSSMHMTRNPNYNNYQGGVTNQQQGYHQTMPSQPYMNQQQSSNMGQGYSMGNMQMQGGAMNQPTGYGMSSGMPVQNQSGMMGGQQPPQYSMMGQQARTVNRMNPHHHMNATGPQSGMMQMQGMGGGQNAMNPPMGRPMQMVNQGMGSQYVPQQQETAQMVNMRRTMPNQSMPSQGGMYN